MLSKTIQCRTMQPMVKLLKIIHYKTIHRKPIGNHSFQDHFTTANVKDIFSLKQAFPTSFDTVGNMPGKYSIKIDTTVPPVQHARCKVPIHYKEEIEKKTSRNGTTTNNCTSYNTYRVGLIYYIPNKTRWFPQDMLRPPRLK